MSIVFSEVRIRVTVVPILLLISFVGSMYTCVWKITGCRAEMYPLGETRGI